MKEEKRDSQWHGCNRANDFNPNRRDFSLGKPRNSVMGSALLHTVTNKIDTVDGKRGNHVLYIEERKETGKRKRQNRRYDASSKEVGERWCNAKPIITMDVYGR